MKLLPLDEGFKREIDSTVSRREEKREAKAVSLRTWGREKVKHLDELNAKALYRLLGRLSGDEPIKRTLETIWG